jgi:hypothetical protein
MSIIQFIWQILVISGLIVAFIIGLFSAPWYVLGSVLTVALIVTWRLMPKRESWVVETLEAISNESEFKSKEFKSKEQYPSTDPHHSPDLLYRGAHYSSNGMPAANASVQSTPLTYRGAPYIPETQNSRQPVESVKKSVVPLLKYRGANIQPEASQR